MRGRGEVTGRSRRPAETIDRAALTPALQTDAEILSHQLRDRQNELRFRAFEIPMGSREGFDFDQTGAAQTTH